MVAMASITIASILKKRLNFLYEGNLLQQTFKSKS